MKQIIAAVAALLIINLSCSPLKQAAKQIERAQSIRDNVAATIVIPKDSITYTEGKTITKVIIDTFNNVIKERYYYYKNDTVRIKTFDTEKSEALQRMYYEQKGNYAAQLLLTQDLQKRELWQYLAIAIFIVIIIVQSKFKF